jgi:hypothetical protein
MNMTYNEIANSSWMYAWVAVVVVLTIAQSIFFMLKAWKRGRELGLSPNQLRKGITIGFSISILPSLPVLLVLISLMPLMGVPLPWLRLSVIGSPMIETIAANIGVTAVGEEMVVNGYSAYAWSSAAWTMTVAGCATVLWSVIATKPISSIYDKAAKINIKLVLAIGSACITAVMANASTSFGFSAIRTKGVVFGASFVLGALIMMIQKKYPQYRLADYNMGVSMIFGMIAACLVLG